MKVKILIVEESESLRHWLKTELDNKGYDTITASFGKQAQEIAESHCPDLVLLSEQLTDMDSVALLKKIREWSSVPIIVIGTSYDEDYTVYALDSGADDYITTPLGISELLSRIKLALRHSVNYGSNSVNIHNSRFEVGDLVVDYDKYCVYIGGRDAELTQNEFRLVALLGKNAGRVLTYQYIITQLWGPNAVMDNQILRVNMANIRKKLEEKSSAPRYITTIAGIGYKMAAE